MAIGEIDKRRMFELLLDGPGLRRDLMDVETMCGPL